MSNKIWPHVTTQNPCPVCGKPDWCQFGDRAVKCMREPSAHSCPSGGWYHFYGESEKHFAHLSKPTQRREKPKINCMGMLLRWQCGTYIDNVAVFAGQLGVSMLALQYVEAVWASDYNAWAFPMKDENMNRIGIRLRNGQGFKWAVNGSSQGLFISSHFQKTKRLYLLEGPTDLAAAFDLGLPAIARPTCNSGNDLARKFIEKNGIQEVVIVGDNDDLKKRGNSGDKYRPGIEGALNFKKDLAGIKSVIWLPPSPIKDLREFKKAGGTRQIIESEVAKKVWTRK